MSPGPLSVAHRELLTSRCLRPGSRPTLHYANHMVQALISITTRLLDLSVIRKESFHPSDLLNMIWREPPISAVDIENILT